MCIRDSIRPYYSYMLRAMFIKFLGALVELLIPYLLETILDDVVPTGSRRGILLTGGAMVLCACLLYTSGTAVPPGDIPSMQRALLELPSPLPAAVERARVLWDCQRMAEDYLALYRAVTRQEVL